MKLKNEIEYVFRILNYLSLQNKDRIVTSTEIAENENIPHLFSIRVLKKMEKKGLLKIFKGANGGYKLNKDPKDITLRDAVETIEDEIIIKDRSCVAGQTSCSVIFKALESVENNFLNNLDKVNLKVKNSSLLSKFLNDKKSRIRYKSGNSLCSDTPEFAWLILFDFLSKISIRNSLIFYFKLNF